MEEVAAQLDRLGFRRLDIDRPTPAETVAAYERELGRRLPHDFRWFCLTHGAGALGSCRIELPDLGPCQYDRLGGDLRYRDLYVEPQYPPGLVDCGSDVMGNTFFLRLDPGDDGGVWFWNYYAGADPWTGMVRAAADFTDLLRRTTPSPPSTA